MEENCGNRDIADQVGQARIDALWQALHRDIRKRGVDVHTADDVAQETWLRTVCHPPRQGESLRPWLRVVARRVLNEILRRDRRRLGRERRVARVDSCDSEGCSNEDSHVMQLVGDLPSPYREVISLRYLEDLDVEEIARRLGTTPGTVRSQLKRGVDRLRVRLGGEGQHAPRRSWFVWPWSWPGGRGPQETRLVRWAICGCIVLGTALVWSSLRAERHTRDELMLVSEAVTPTSTTTIASDDGSRIRSGIDPAVFLPDIESAPGRTTFGTVRLPDGTPIGGATVWKVARTGREEVGGITDEDGRFSTEFDDVQTLLWATHPDWVPSRQHHACSGTAETSVDLVLVQPQGRLEIVVQQDGRPIAGAEVQLDWGSNHPASVVLSSNGTLQVEIEDSKGKTDERGRIVLHKPPRSDVLLGIRLPGRARHVEMLALEDGDSRLEVLLPIPATLSGQVVDESGVPSPKARMELLTRGGEDSLQFQTDGSGAFEVSLDPESFELRAFEDAARGQGFCRLDGTLEAGERRPIRLQLTREGTLRGRAFLAGKPLADAMVRCEAPWTSGRRPIVRPVPTAADGSFQFRGLNPDAEVKLQLFTRDLAMLCERESVRVGPDEVILSADSVPELRTLEVEFFSEDPALIPTLLEVTIPRVSDARVFEVDAAGRCTIQVAESSYFVLTPWVPSVGQWAIESSELDPGTKCRIRVPRPSSISFSVDLPPGTPLGSLRAGVRESAFAFLCEKRGVRVFRELLLDPTSLSVTIHKFPGRHNYFFEAPGLAHAAGTVAVSEGEQVFRSVHMREGVEVEVTVPFREEERLPVLALIASDGWHELEGVHGEVTDTAAVFHVSLPRDTMGLEAFLRNRKGSIVIQPGQLAPGRPPPSLRIELEAEKSAELGERRRQAAGRSDVPIPPTRAMRRAK